MTPGKYQTTKIVQRLDDSSLVYRDRLKNHETSVTISFDVKSPKAIGLKACS